MKFRKTEKVNSIKSRNIFYKEMQFRLLQVEYDENQQINPKSRFDCTFFGKVLPEIESGDFGSIFIDNVMEIITISIGIRQSGVGHQISHGNRIQTFKYKCMK